STTWTTSTPSCTRPRGSSPTSSRAGPRTTPRSRASSSATGRQPPRTRPTRPRPAARRAWTRSTCSRIEPRHAGGAGNATGARRLEMPTGPGRFRRVCDMARAGTARAAQAVPPSALTRRASRDFCRAARFGWITRRVASRSSSAAVSRNACVACAPSCAWRTFLIAVLRRERCARFRAARLRSWSIRLVALLLLGKQPSPDVPGSPCQCKRKSSGYSRHLSTRDSPWRAEPASTLTRPVEPKDSPGADGHRRHPGARPGVAPGPHRALAYPPMELLLVLPVLLLSVVLHEYAHGWMALRQGDRTALDAGRLTMNPIAHIDPVGSIIVPLFLWLAPGNILFGWARPVPVNPRNYRNYRRGDILVSVAGVAANLLLAALFTVMIIVLIHLGRVLRSEEHTSELQSRENLV